MSGMALFVDRNFGPTWFTNPFPGVAPQTTTVEHNVESISDSHNVVFQNQDRVERVWVHELPTQPGGSIIWSKPTATKIFGVSFF